MKIALRGFAGIFFILGSAQAFGMMVAQMNLGEMVTKAEHIVHGKVVNIETGTVSVGGGTLPTIKYTVQVTEVLKGKIAGQATNTKRIQITMLGQSKPSQGSGELVRFSGMQEGSTLKLDREYLLMLTKPSSIGLSTTVGLGQGAFEFLEDGIVRNEVGNVGLFEGMNGNGDKRRLSSSKPGSNGIEQNIAGTQIDNQLTYGALKQHIITVINGGGAQ